MISSTGRTPVVAQEWATAGPGGPVRTGTHGLPLAAAALLATGVGAAGAAVDLLLSGELGLVFMVLFVLGCALAASWVRVRHVRATAVMPPLLFALLCAGGAAVTTRHAAGSLPVRVLLETSTSMLTVAPALFIGTGVAALIWLVRSRRARRDVRY